MEYLDDFGALLDLMHGSITDQYDTTAKLCRVLSTPEIVRRHDLDTVA